MKLALYLTATLFLTSPALAICHVDALPENQRAESSSFIVGYRLEPDRIEVANHFSVLLDVCRKDGAPYAGTPVVDAHMPVHRHGMNYRPKITKLDDGTFRADGFLFHMPGKWQFKIDIMDGNVSERITLDYRL